MPHFVALLRGINLGKRRIKMTQLAGLFTELGFTEVSTVLASGNVVFATSRRSSSALEKSIAAHLKKSLGYDVATQVRTADEIRQVIDDEPLRDLFTDQPHANTQVTFFSRALSRDQTAEIEGQSGPTDQLKVVGRELYWRCATKISESPLWKDAGKNPHNLPAGTTRNIRTLQKIADRLKT